MMIRCLCRLLYCQLFSFLSIQHCQRISTNAAHVRIIAVAGVVAAVDAIVKTIDIAVIRRPSKRTQSTSAVRFGVRNAIKKNDCATIERATWWQLDPLEKSVRNSLKGYSHPVNLQITQQSTHPNLLCPCWP